VSNAGPVQHQPIAPMMRVLWQEVRDRIHLAFAEEGYGDVRAEHLAVLQHPGPDGQRPSALAARSGMSRQAINHLVSHLERAGYLERYAEPSGSRRLLRLTESGRRLYGHIEAVAATVEAEWAQQVGPGRLEDLRAILSDLLTARPDRPAKQRP
jgi:DNA-binding MarR family transcriptional regulator